MFQLFFQREECIGFGPFVGYLLARHGAYVIFGQCALYALLSPPVPSIIFTFSAAEGAVISAYVCVYMIIISFNSLVSLFILNSLEASR